LSEDQQIGTTRKFYADREADEAIKAAVGNVLDFFDWAHDSRNKIPHSERYPPGLGANRSCHGVVVVQFEIRRS
jgi:hypothetical protein